MRLIIFHVLLLAGIAICQAQSPFQFSSFGSRPSSVNNGRYQPNLRTTTYRPYQASVFGNKRVDNSGRYQPVLQTTTYRPSQANIFGNKRVDNSGRYQPVLQTTTYRPSQANIFGNKRVDNSGRYQPVLQTSTYRPYQTNVFGNKQVDNSGRYQPVLQTTTYRPYRPIQPSVFGKVDNSGRYNPGNSGRYKPVSDGRYTPVTVGKYQPSDDGKYTDELGRYKDSGHGKYINGKYVDGPYVDGKYVGDSSGFYEHNDNPYEHKDVGGGQYKGQNVPYDPYKDKQYPGGAYKGDKSEIGYKNSQTPFQGANVGSKSRAYRPTSSGVALPAVDPKYVDASGYSTLGVPQGLEKSNAAGLYDKRNYAIIIDNKEISPKGDYHYQYETENKIYGEEYSKVVSDTEEHKNGYYKYTGPDSNVYIVTYNAGVEGFVPEAKHIPTEPPVPELIQRSLDYKRAVGLL